MTASKGPRRTERVPELLPLYHRVLLELESLALTTALSDTTPIPTEAQLMERYAVSRGTVRRAIDELVRQGLLRAEAGRGTFVNKRVQVRRRVVDRLIGVAIPDSRFDLDVLQFVPDFLGSAAAQDRLRSLKWYRDATTVFIAPDNSLERLRRLALDDGKRIIVPTYGLRRGMVLLAPRSVRPAARSAAATLDGMERHGRSLALDDLRALGSVDLLVTGATAVSTDGVHVGGGQAYLDLEWGLLAELGVVEEATPVVAIVHPCQLIEQGLAPGPFDLTVDVIATPHEIIRTHRVHPRPAGIGWDSLSIDLQTRVAYLADLADRGRTTPQPRGHHER